MVNWVNNVLILDPGNLVATELNKLDLCATQLHFSQQPQNNGVGNADDDYGDCDKE